MNSLMLQPLRKYADFHGRARRSEYWLFVLFHVLLWLGLIVFVVLMSAVGEATDSPSITALGVLIAWCALMVIAVGLFIPSLAVTVRRLHDIDTSGWWLLLNLIPLGGLVIVVMCLFDGTAGFNEYGRDPKGRGVGGANETVAAVFS